MVEPRNQLLPTVTVTRSQVFQAAERATALTVTTRESGTTAFVLSLETIAVLRKELAHAEALLRRAPGHA
jgi:hypothetical protein